MKSLFRVAINVAGAIGITLGLTFFVVGTVLEWIDVELIDRAFDWGSSKFAVPPRKSWEK